MPILDMPLHELKAYQGSNPKPADFDAFWDSQLAALDGVDPQVELTPAEFQTPFAECFHMTYAGVGGARIYAKLVRPKSPRAPHPAVLQFHGYSGDSGDWHEKLALAAAGYTVAAMDCRGQGGRSQDPGGHDGWTLRGHIVRGLDGPAERMAYVQMFLDTAQLARAVMAMDDVDADRVGASGGSQGGGLTLACAALEPRIKLAAPVFPFLTDYRRVWHLDLGGRAYEEIREWFKRFDPRHQRVEEVFTRLGYIDVQHLCPRIRAEVFLAVGLVDQTCPPSTQFAAYNKIASKKSLAIYPDFGHEGLKGHGDLVYQFLMGL
jgi:cephalosporin-C deacetylase